MKTETTVTVEYTPDQTVDLDTVTPLNFHCMMHAFQSVANQMAQLSELYIKSVNSMKMTEEEEEELCEFEMGKLADRVSTLLEMVVDTMDD